MNRGLGFIIISMFLMSCGAGIKSYKSPHYSSKAINRIAVLPVSEANGISIGFSEGSIQNTILDQLTIDIMQIGMFRVYERSHIARILKEQDFSLSNYMDDEKRIQIGRLANLDALGLVSITVYDGAAGTTDISLNFKLVDVETGEIIYVVNAKSDHAIVAFGTLGESIDVVVDGVVSDLGDNFRSND